MVPSHWLPRRSFPYPANRFTLRLYGRATSLFLKWTQRLPDVPAENLGGWRAVLAEQPTVLRQKRGTSWQLGGLA